MANNASPQQQHLIKPSSSLLSIIKTQTFLTKFLFDVETVRTS